MQEKIIGVLAVAAVIVVIALGGNVWKKQSVKSALNVHITPANVHTFKNRRDLEDVLLADIEKVVGEKANVELELYHLQTRIEEGDLPENTSIPNYGGVQRSGSTLELSALVARVWWTQTTFGQWPQDQHVVKTLMVDADKMGSAYGQCPEDFDEVRDPVLLLDASR